MLSVGCKSAFTWSMLCGVSLLLPIRPCLGSETKHGFACEDGSYATLVHSATHMGNETRTWACPVNLADKNNDDHHFKVFDLCPVKCTTYCEEPALNGSPDPDDCKALASYYAGGGRFTVDPKHYIIWEYNTCRVTQYNRLLEQQISYCFDQHHWAGVVNHLSSHCEPRTGSRGGSCYFYDSLHLATITLEKA